LVFLNNNNYDILPFDPDSLEDIEGEMISKMLGTECGENCDWL
jgi:hypothetical protein